jgi:hypothetical protein
VPSNHLAAWARRTSDAVIVWAVSASLALSIHLRFTPLHLLLAQQTARP